jgi:hypothetical protein
MSSQNEKLKVLVDDSLSMGFLFNQVTTHNYLIKAVSIVVCKYVQELRN